MANTPLPVNGRPIRQVNPPVDLAGNGITNSLPLGTGMPFDNGPRGNLLPNNFGLNKGLPSSLAFNNGLPNTLPMNFLFPNMNIMPQNRLLPSFNGINNNGLPFNNVPTGLPGLNNVPNGLPGLNNEPNGLPSFNNGLPNGIPGLNNVPTGLPSFTNGLPSGLPSQINVPKILPGLNNVPNGLPNTNNIPSFANRFINLNNMPSGTNNLNLNNLPSANSLPNINNIPILNSQPSSNNLPCGNILSSLPVTSGLPQNNSPSGNRLPPNSNQLPYLNNFRITEIGIGSAEDSNRFPHDNQLIGNMSPSTNYLQNVNGLTQQVSDELVNMNMNGFSGMSNMPTASAFQDFLPVDNNFSSVNSFMTGNGIPNIASEPQDIQVTNTEVNNFQNFNEMPVNEQRFVNNVPLNNDFAMANNFPTNVNSKLANAMNNGMPLSNGGYLNDLMPEIYLQNSNGLSSNDFQIGNVQLPFNSWQIAEQNQNMPSGYPSLLTSNNLNLAQELIKNLKIEGLANMPFLNGLPVAGITETVTVLNGPCKK